VVPALSGPDALAIGPLDIERLDIKPLALPH
jgi:hypothetical protein